MSHAIVVDAPTPWAIVPACSSSSPRRLIRSSKIAGFCMLTMFVGQEMPALRMLSTRSSGASCSAAIQGEIQRLQHVTGREIEGPSRAAPEELPRGLVDIRQDRLHLVPPSGS